MSIRKSNQSRRTRAASPAASWDRWTDLVAVGLGPGGLDFDVGPEDLAWLARESGEYDSDDVPPEVLDQAAEAAQAAELYERGLKAW